MKWLWRSLNVNDVSQRRVIVGLGNPGRDYATTRHNVGFMVVREFAKAHGMKWNELKAEAVVAKEKVLGVDVCAVLPKTYMNASGRAVSKVLQAQKAGIADLIIVSDDVDLPFGVLKLKSSGSPGGHNGLKSIHEALGSENYLRLKVGIGRDFEGRSLVDHVLGAFNEEEQKALPQIVKKAAEVLDQLITTPVEKVMNEINQRPKK